MTLKAGPLYALIAAALFGLSTPLAKLMVGSVDPWLLSGLLYFGSGCGVLLVFLIQKLLKKNKSLPRLSGQDWLWLGGATLFGGILGPLSLMYGLSMTSASTASLLLNLEGVLTSTLAWFVFKEHFDRRILIGMILIVLGGCALAWSPGSDHSITMGPLLILGACLSWAIDNNLTRKISASDPLQITMVKSLVAGSINMTLAYFVIGATPSGAEQVAKISLIGFAGYGLSLILFVLSLRHIGTSRTGAYFSVAPFLGALVSIILFQDALTTNLILAGLLMGLGVYLHLTETHDHEHTHEELFHDHIHIHDEHHDHTHDSNIPAGEPHSHPHRHRPLKHSHAHFPDIHHRHSH